MTTIHGCEYSPDLRPLRPLSLNQVGQLNKDGTPTKVRTIVQRHLGYQGEEKYRITLTRQEITFSLKSGSKTEDRTLSRVGDKWMLSKNGSTLTPLAPDLQKEVDGLIDEVLYRIRQSHGAETPMPPYTLSSPADRLTDERSREDLERKVSRFQRTLDRTTQKNKEDFEQLHRDYESAQRLGLSRYEELQRQLYELEQTSGDKDAEIRKLQEHIAASEASLAEKEAARQQSQKELEVLRKQAEEALKKAAAEHSELEAATKTQQALLENQLRAAQEEGERLKAAHAAAVAEVEKANAEKAAEVRALDEQLATLKASAAGKAAELDTAQARLNEIEPKYKAALAQQRALESSIRAQKDSFERQLRAAQEERARLTATHEKALTASDLRVADLERQNTDLASKARKAEEAFASDTAGFQQQIKEKEAEFGRNLAEEKEKITRLQSDLAKSVAKLEELQRQNTASLSELKTQHAAELSARDSRTDELSRKLESENLTNQAEISSLQETQKKHLYLLRQTKLRLDQQKQAIETLEAQNKEYENLLRARNGELALLRSRLQEIETVYQEVPHSLERVEGKREFVQTAIYHQSMSNLADAAAPKPFKTPKSSRDDD